MQWRISIPVICLMVSGSCAEASPTSNEFLPCHQRAASVLVHCLDEMPGSTDDKCWELARHQKSSCYDEVVKSHHRDRDRIEAEKALKLRQLAAAANNQPSQNETADGAFHVIVFDECDQLTGAGAAAGKSVMPPYQVVQKTLACADMTQDVANLDALDRDMLFMWARELPLDQLKLKQTKTDPPQLYSSLTSTMRLAKFKQLVDAYYRPRPEHVSL